MAASDLTHRFSPACVISATGPDALTFLQGQFTQDLRALSPGSGAYGLWLNAKGKVLADSIILPRDKDSFLIVSEFAPASVVLARLNAYLIADEVELSEESGRWVATWSFGSPPTAGGAPAKIPGPVERWLELAPLENSTLPVTGTSPAYSLFRYTNRLPAIPLEFGESDLPQEAGLELHAISFTKGCYLGQEVMARLHAMGQVRRQLVTVAGSGALPTGRFPVSSGGKPCGELRGAVALPEGGWAGLAMLSRYGASEGQPLLCEGQKLLVSWPKA